MKKLILFGIVILMLASLGSAAIDSTDLVGCWDLSSTAVFDTDKLLDVSGSGNDMTIVSMEEQNVDNFRFDGSTSRTYKYGTQDFNFSDGDFTVIAIGNPETNGVSGLENREIFTTSFEQVGLFFGIGDDDDAHISIDYGNGAAPPDIDDDVSIFKFAINRWYFMALRRDSDNVTFFMNNTDAIEKANSVEIGSESIYYHDLTNIGTMGSQWWDGWIKTIVVYKGRALTQTELEEAYTGGYNCSDYVTAPPPPESTNTINLSSPLPANNTLFGVSTFNFNVTANNSNQMDCSIYINETLEETITEYSAGTNTFVDFDVTFLDGTHNFTIGCWDGENDTNTSTNIFYVDTVDPTITVDSTLSGNRLICYEEINISASINLSDLNLWGFNLTVDKSNVIFNITNISGSTYNYNMNFDPSDYNLNEGEHTLNIFASDSHTSKEIPDYYYSKNPLSKSITYYFGDDWIEIKPTNKGLFSSFDTWKNKDRYAFEFERDFTAKLLYGTDLEFEVSSSRKLDSVDSEFPGHIVSNDLMKWIDFDSQYKDAVVTTTKINDRTIKVFIEGIEDDAVLFNSIGGLNVVEQNYTFYYGNITETYVDEAIETELTTFTTNFSINDSYVGDIDATLYWNGTYYTTTTKTTSSDSIYFTRDITTSLISGYENLTNYTFFWNYTIINNATGNNITNDSTTQRDQLIYRMILSNCSYSVANTTAINFSVLDQVFDTVAYVVPEGSFVVWYGSAAVTRTYGLNWGNSSSFNLCIYPATNNLSTSYTLLYSGYGDTNSRIRSNDTLNNITEYVTLYISTSGDDISINVVDESDDALSGLNVEAWMYSVVDNNYTLIAEEETDPDGLAIMRLYTAGEDKYQFRIYDGSDLLYTSSTFKIWETSYTFRIVRGIIPNSTLIALQSLNYNLAIDKTNDNFTLTWDDTETGLISAINLTVVMINATNETRLSSQISNDVSGTLFYTVSDNGTYIAYVYATSSGDGLVYFLKSISHRIAEEWDLFGTDVMIMTLLFIGTMAFIGLAHSRGGELSLILTIFGMVVFWIMGFIQVALSGVVSIAIAALIILVRLQKRR